MNIQDFKPLIDRIDAFLKTLMSGKGSVHYTLEYNDQHSSYSTLADEKEHMEAMHKSGQDFWTAFNRAQWLGGGEDQVKALANDTIWELNFYKLGDVVNDFYACSNLRELLSGLEFKYEGEEDAKLVDQLSEKLITLLKGKWTDLSFSYNEHSYAQINPPCDTIEETFEILSIEEEDFVSSEEYKKALEQNQLIRFQWYPQTPVGFHVVYATTLYALIEAAFN
jgi:hypothetical protein